MPFRDYGVCKFFSVRGYASGKGLGTTDLVKEIIKLIIDSLEKHRN